MDKSRISLVIPAAGIGSRFKSDVKKQFFEIDKKPILYYVLKRLKSAYPFDSYIIGASPDDFDYIKQIAIDSGIANITLTKGGATRADTVFNALLSCHTDYVAIHDAVRPFVSDEIINNVINAGIANNAAICGIYAKDTIKKVDNGKIIETVDRSKIFLAHTPQVFKRSLLIDAIKKSVSDKILLTDDASAVEYFGHSVSAVLSSPHNIKITEQDDMEFVNSLFTRYFRK